MSKRKFTTTVRETEAKEQAAIEQSGTTLRLATEREARAERDLDQAETHVRQIEASWVRLSEEHSAGDHAEAVSAAKRAERMSVGARRAREAAAKAHRSTDISVAEVVAEMLRPAFPATTVVPTFVDVGDEPTAAERPVLVVHQSAAANRTAAGTLEGSVTLIYYRTDLHLPLAIGTIEDAATASGVGVHTELRVRTSRSVDRLELDVRGARQSARPVIPTIGRSNVRALGTHLTGAIVAGTRYWDERVRSDLASGLMQTGRVAAMPITWGIVEQEVSPAGERTLTVEAEVGLWQKKEPLTHPTAHELIEAVVSETGGKFLAGLGVVDAIEWLPGEEATPASEVVDTMRRAGEFTVDARAHGIEFTFAQAVKVRAVLLSSTGENAETGDREDDAA